MINKIYAFMGEKLKKNEFKTRIFCHAKKIKNYKFGLWGIIHVCSTNLQDAL